MTLMDGTRRLMRPRFDTRSGLATRCLGITGVCTLAACVLLAGCGALPAAIGGMGGGSTTPASSKADKSGAIPGLPAPNFGELKLSSVTIAGLISSGVRDTEGLIRWFNEPSPDADPFYGPMVGELDGVRRSAKSFSETGISAVTIEALSKNGVTEPSAVRDFDRALLDKSRMPRDLCRNEIGAELRKTGWTVLRVEVTNRPGASSLLLNGEFVGALAEGDSAVWRRFVVKAPGPSSDLSTMATLSVELPSAQDGLPPVRWFKDVELVRGGELQFSLDVASAPVPSIGFAAKRPLSPASVYAGDSVTLTCEGAGEDTIWFMLGETSELSSGNYRTAPSASSAAAGLPVWFKLRASAKSSASPRASLIEEPAMQPVVIGRGPTLDWRPQFETPTARLGVLVRDASGFWGFAERSIAVADLRPGLWSVPALPVDPSTLDAAVRAAQAIDPSPINIYDTHAVLDQLLYVAKVATPVVLDLRIDEFRDASLPLARVSVDFGDGSPAMEVPAADAAKAQVEHSYAKEGMYRVSVKSVDIMGFERSHGTNIVVRSDAPAAPAASPATAVAGSSVRTRVATTAAESSFDLFRRAANQFASTVTARTARALNGRKVAIAHIHDFKNQHLVDLMDGTLVSTLLRGGANVYEREPVFQHAIGARGFVDASTVVVSDQGAKASDAGSDSTTKPTEQADALPDVDVVIEYKLKRAEVEVVPSGAMVLRTARIFAWVRVHDRRTMQILFDDAVAVAVGGTIAATEAAAAGTPWDSYPAGFMLRAGPTGGAIKIAEEPNEPSDPDAPSAPKDAVPVEPFGGTEPASPPSQSTPGLGGALKGLLGG